MSCKVCRSEIFWLIVDIISKASSHSLYTDFMTPCSEKIIILNHSIFVAPFENAHWVLKLFTIPINSLFPVFTPIFLVPLSFLSNWWLSNQRVSSSGRKPPLSPRDKCLTSTSLWFDCHWKHCLF